MDQKKLNPQPVTRPGVRKDFVRDTERHSSSLAFSLKPEAEVAIAAALVAYPLLTVAGMGVEPGSDFVAWRENFSFDRVATCIAFLRQCRKTKTATLNSYGLKHAAERWGRAHGMSNYVANGDIIVAAHFLDFKIKTDFRTINALIGVDRYRVQELDPTCIWASNWRGGRFGRWR